MRKNLRYLGRFLALALMAAVVLRPVVVATQNASAPPSGSISAHSPALSLAGQAAQDQAYAKVGTFTPLRVLQKEKSDPSPLGVHASSPVAFQAFPEGLSPHSLRSPSSSPRAFQVLRI